MDLRGQVVLITGGSRGLGRAFAQALLAAGARVAITARSAPELHETAAQLSSAAGQVVAIPADATDPGAAPKVVATAEERLGPITLLINNAGQSRAVGPIRAVDPIAWWNEVEVNLRGPFLYAHAVLPSMLTRRSGRIINVASIAGLQAIPTMSAYVVGKTALLRFSENLALETAQHGIQVFSIHPGVVRTPMNDYLHDSPEVAKSAPGVQQWYQALYAEGRDTPIGRSVELVLRLAGGDADALSGRYLSVDDDLDTLVKQFAAEPSADQRTLRLHAIAPLSTGALLAAAPPGARADDAALAPREVPAKSIPVPTDVSPGMQKFIAAPLNPVWHDLWKTGEEWRKAADKMDAAIVPTIPAMAERLHVKIEPSTMDGVKVFIVTPDEIPPENRNRLLIHIHGGCYVLFPGEAGATEAITMAGLEHFKVISVDYRMPPEAYLPAAIDDVLTVYKAAQRTTDPKNMAIFGTSAGGALTLAVILRAKEQGVALPGAISAGTPMSDATKTGDSFYTNELVDNVLVSRDGFCDAATVVYANGHDLRDPLISPVYGDMHGFPPTILTTGTRDLLLSNTVRVHRALRAAGVEAELEVYEGQSHAQYLFDDRLPETAVAFGEIAEFFDKHLGK